MADEDVRTMFGMPTVFDPAILPVPLAFRPVSPFQALMDRLNNEIMAAYGLNDLGMTELVERNG